MLRNVAVACFLIFCEMTMVVCMRMQGRRATAQGVLLGV